MKNFIDANKLEISDKTIIIDVRTGNEEETARRIFQKEHLKGAFFMDVDEDLSSKPTETSGKHPLPKLKDFKAKLESFGARNDSDFIIYDNGDNFSAGRLWFILKYFGIDRAKIINGGYKSIKAAFLEVTSDLSNVKVGNIDLKERVELLASFEEVKEYSKNPSDDKVLIDSRAYERYLGLVEPLYAKAGHIPGAKSYFFADNYKEDGTLKDLEELHSRFDEIKDKDIMVSCGSGVTACSNLVVLDELGIEARLYNGSFSQWIDMGEEIESHAQND